MSTSIQPSPSTGKTSTSLPSLDRHPLKHSYTLYFQKRGNNVGTQSQDQYEKNLKKIGSFGSIEEFWSLYNHLLRPFDMPSGAEYDLFKTGIKPMWEDDANRHGGKFFMRYKNTDPLIAAKDWEAVVFAMIGEQFEVDDICGLIVSIRGQETIMSLWIRDASNAEVKTKIQATLAKILSSPDQIVQYRNHSTKEKPEKQ